MFENLLVSKGEQEPRRRSTWLISGILHAGVLVALLLTPIIHYSTLTELSPLTYLAPLPVLAAPLPPAPPAPVRRVARPQTENPVPVVFREDPRLATSIPEAPELIPEVNLYSLLDEPGEGIPGGNPGLPVGLSGSLGLGLAARVPELAPVPARPAEPEPLPVGGSIQQARKVVHVQPVYPDLAVRARVEGVVLIEALIDELGSVGRIRILRGHPLLNEATLTAVRQWKYSPTLLNGEPVPVITTISVVFSLR